MSLDPQSLSDLVTANKILFREGIVDAFGHVSVRDPEHAERYWLARSVQPPLVTAADIVEYDLDSNPVEAGAPPGYFERFIHGEIYRVRPDVHGIVHSHSPTVLPFSVSRSTRLRAVCHTGGFLGLGAPVFEIRDALGDGSDMLVKNRPLGVALAKSLAGSMMVLMRGHGFTVAGGSLKEAVYNAIYAEINARVQLDAERLGEVAYMSDAEAAATSHTHNASLDRTWEIWKRRALGQFS